MSADINDAVPINSKWECTSTITGMGEFKGEFKVEKGEIVTVHRHFNYGRGYWIYFSRPLYVSSTLWEPQLSFEVFWQHFKKVPEKDAGKVFVHALTGMPYSSRQLEVWKSLSPSEQEHWSKENALVQPAKDSASQSSQK